MLIIERQDLPQPVLREWQVRAVQQEQVTQALLWQVQQASVTQALLRRVQQEQVMLAALQAADQRFPWNLGLVPEPQMPPVWQSEAESAPVRLVLPCFQARVPADRVLEQLDLIEPARLEQAGLPRSAPPADSDSRLQVVLPRVHRLA